MIDKSALSVDESNLVAQYEAVKEKVRQDVNAGGANHADRLDENEQAQAAAVCGQLKRKALNELVNKESELERSRGIVHRLLRLPAHRKTAI